MPDFKKKPCRVCRRWFRPDVRLGSRQHTCSRPECQTIRRRRTQASWRAQNPGYFLDWRIQKRSESKHTPEPLRLPHPLSALPWDLAQSEFGRKGSDFIQMLSAVLLRTAKDQFTGQLNDYKRVAAPLALMAPKDQIRTQLTDSS